ncbi:MAG TPA: carboxypeptidase-like regulatory domain-containing protein [Flavisolibacter sp.]|nr:carboxypeptidase-like regulatory domain-containing protein [Flavisolibacter sp.]
MRALYRSFILVMVAVLGYQCQREISIDNLDPVNNNPNPITANLQGNVVDENGLPVASARVKIGNETIMTNARGYFRLNKAPLDKQASVVTVEKSGYFKAYRSFSATSGTNQVMVKLVPKTLAGTIASSTGGEVSLSNGSKISLPANGVTLASGDAYSGEVRVFAAYIDPTAEDIAQTVPGSFMADDKDNKRVTLGSYGMLAVELESPSGQKLQVRQGSKATLDAPIPSSLQASAPSTIALWYVDETTGIWKEEGQATKQGNRYVGEVSHFSFWNYDISIPAVTLSLALRNQEGGPLVHAHVRISRIGPGVVGTAHGITDSLGQVSGFVPSNENLLLEVLNPCNAAVYSQNLNPLTQNTNLGSITVAANPSFLVTLKGRLVNCAGNAVSNGLAIVEYDNVIRYAQANSTGNFSLSLLRCGTSPSTVQVIGVDEGSSQQGNIATINLTPGITDAGDLAACGVTVSEFITYTLDGTVYNHTSATDSIMKGSSIPDSTLTGQLVTYITASGSSNQFIQLVFKSASPAAGTYAAQLVSFTNYFNNTIVPPFNIVLTSFPQNIAQFYEGSFSGQFRDAQNVVHTVTNGSFKLRRN